MTVQDAIRVMGTTATISMQSDGTLSSQVARQQATYIAANPGSPQKSVIIPARGLDDNRSLRPISAMLELARGTVLNEDPDIAAFARRWSTLRHLGIFEVDALDGTLRLATSALQYIGPNQRRVLSEDLGIGIGIVVAKQWCRLRTGTIGPVRAIDVDRALSRGTVPGLRPVGSRQPDYLLAYPDPSDPNSTVYELLETKGTVSLSTAKRQLGRAVTQLAGLTVGGRVLTGLAVSTVSTRDDIRVLSVDPEEHMVTWTATQQALENSRTRGERYKEDVAKLDLGEDELFAAATNVDNAALAEFGGQYGAARRWLPSLGAAETRQKNAVVRRNFAGIDFVGTELAMDVPEARGRVRVFQGVEVQVAAALNDLDVSAVAQAQRAFAEANSETDGNVPPEIGRPASTSAFAFSSDGSVLEIAAES